MEALPIYLKGWISCAEMARALMDVGLTGRQALDACAGITESPVFMTASVDDLPNQLDDDSQLAVFNYHVEDGEEKEVFGYQGQDGHFLTVAEVKKLLET